MSDCKPPLGHTQVDYSNSGSEYLSPPPQNARKQFDKEYLTPPPPPIRVAGDWLEVKEEGGKAKGKKARRDLCDQAAPVQWTTTGNVVTITLSVATAGHGYNLTYRMEKSPQTGNSEWNSEDQLLACSDFLVMFSFQSLML